MEDEVYEISPNSGRLRKRIRFKKHRPKKILKTKIKNFFQHPVFIFTIVVITGVLLYFSLQEPAKKNSRKRPTAKSVRLNDNLKADRTPED